MFQLRNLINRKSVPSDPSTNMNAAEDFLKLLLHAHGVAAAKVIMSFNSMDSVTDLANAVIVNFVHLPIGCDDKVSSLSEDGVYLYGMELLSLSLLWHGFHDAIREGDGDRILRYWKFLLLIFKCSKKFNYAKEAVILLLQYFYIFSERQREQLLWSRCINTRGRQGTNIPCDLHMEHLNRRLKIVLRNLGANITPKAVEKAGKSIRVIEQACKAFEEQTSSYHSSDHHPYPAFGKDFSTVLKELEDQSVFVPQCSRQHSTFENRIKRGFLLNKLSKKVLLAKIKKNIDQIYK